jgi:hypothetical protein
MEGSEMKKQNISIIITVKAKTKKEAKEAIIRLMNRATCAEPEFPTWGFHNEYQYANEKVKK